MGQILILKKKQTNVIENFTKALENRKIKKIKKDLGLEE